MKFSIVLICFNQRVDIVRAVDSALGQTHPEVEVIVVDDGSSDGSPEVIEARLAGRGTLIRHEQNMGAHMARRTGLNAATGDYLLFLDGDDLLKEDCCARLDALLKARPYDLVGMGAQVVIDGWLTAQRKAEIEEYIAPYNGELHGEAIFKSCFLEGLLPHNVITICHAMPLARQTQLALDNSLNGRKITKSDDYLFFFAETYFAKSYCGIADKLYVYNYGNGVSSSLNPTKARLLNKLRAWETEEACLDFARAHGIYNDDRREAVARRRKGDILEIFASLGELEPDARDEVAAALLARYGVANVVTAVAQRHRNEKGYIFNTFNIAKLFPVNRQCVKTVAMFYRRAYNGGIERVMSCLCGILAGEGYRVVVVTDEEENEQDYPMPGAERVVLGTVGEDGDYTRRFAGWQACIEKHGIDAVIYHQWVAADDFHDFCAIKSAGAAVVLHSHGVFTAALGGGSTGALDAAGGVKHADALAVLSNVDRIYWQRLNGNTHLVANPLTFDVNAINPAALASHNILWVGRFDYLAKNPDDALLILQRVLEFVPDATLTMVGAHDPLIGSRFQDRIKELGLAGRVTMAGFQLDVAPYYREAAVMLMTSSYEGYPMALMEALSFGLPVVTYNLPYLSAIKECPSIETVPWRDCDAAAGAVCRLLADPEERKKRGNGGRAYALVLARRDLGKMWRGILDSTVAGHREPPPPPTAEETSELIETVNLALRQMARTINQDFRIQLLNPSLEYQKREIRGSARYRLGNALLLPPTMIKQFFLLIKKHSLGETFKILGEMASGRREY